MGTSIRRAIATASLGRESMSVSFRPFEVVGTGLDVVVNVGTSTTTENPSLVRVSGFYSGSVSHQINVQVYNYTSSGWDTVGVMLNRSSAFDYTFPLTTDDHNPSTGEMKIRFVHNVTTYNATHYLALDYVSFEKVATNSQLASDVAFIVSKVIPLPNDPASQSLTDAAIPSAATTAIAVRTELTTELGRMDVAFSTRSDPGTAQTISSNADITAIKAKTDNLPASPAAVGSAMTLATNAVSADALATDAVTEIVNGVWDEV